MVALLDLADIQDAKIDTPARLLVHSAQQIRGLLVGEDEDNLGSREITFTYPENPQGEKTVNITARIPYSSRLFHSNGGFLLPSIKPIEATKDLSPFPLLITSIPSDSVPTNTPAIPDDVATYEQLLYWAASIEETLGLQDYQNVVIRVFDSNPSSAFIEIEAQFLLNHERWQLGGDLISSIQLPTKEYNLANSPIQSTEITQDFPVTIFEPGEIFLGTFEVGGNVTAVRINHPFDFNEDADFFGFQIDGGDTSVLLFQSVIDNGSVTIPFDEFDHIAIEGSQFTMFADLDSLSYPVDLIITAVLE